MAVARIEGIVLSETNYSESSKILNVLTEEGTIGVLAKGCRSLKSPLRSVSAKLSYGIFHIYRKEKGLSTLTSVDVLNPFLKMRSDIVKISYASFLLELANQVERQTESSKNIYQILIAALKKIEEGFDPEVITAIVELKYLEELGVKPEIDCCSVCGSPHAIVTVDVTKGGYVCQNCYHHEKIYSNKMITLIRMLYYVDLNKISKLIVRPSIKQELKEFIDQYYDRYTGLYLKSKQFIENLSKIR